MEKIKQFIESNKVKDIMVVLIVILVGLGSFELGRLSKGGSEGLKIEYGQGGQGASTVSATSPQNGSISATGKNYFASSKGKKYYPLGCAAGQNLKMENRIYFSTTADAEKAGYTLSSSCN